MNMKLQCLAILLLVATLPATLHAADKVVHLSYDSAMAQAMKDGKLDGTVKFYFADDVPSGQVTVVNDNATVNRKTNAFGKKDQVTCDWVLQSALIALQDDAKAAGANAVIDIVSDYDGKTYRDAHNYECHVGFLMSGVQLKAKLAKVR
jgi:hypothetical protein